MGASASRAAATPELFDAKCGSPPPYPWCEQRRQPARRFMVWQGTSGTGNSMHSLVSTSLLAAALCRTLIHPYDDRFAPVAGASSVASCPAVQRRAAGISAASVDAKRPHACHVAATQHGSRPDHLSRYNLSAPAHDGRIIDPWHDCPVVVVRGNQYFVRALLTSSPFYRRVASAERAWLARSLGTGTNPLACLLGTILH